RRVCFDLHFLVCIRQYQDWFLGKQLLKLFKSFLSPFVPYKLLVFFCKLMQRFSDGGKVLYEPSVIVAES
ncbi:hypothetical protein PLEOSDRAFT_1042521, partial [Pleurotus ostreatus PC15]